MKIAVTGATGHVGANLCRTLLANGHEVIALYFQKKNLKSLEGLNVQLKQGNVLDINFLRSAFTDVEIVINLAAVISINGDPNGIVMRTNTEGPRNVATACLENDVRRLIHFSSIHAYKYDASDTIVNEEKPSSDSNSYPYEHSKAAGEQEILKAVQKGLDAVIVNPTGIIGPYDFRPSRSGQLFLDLYHKKLPALVEGGFNWVHVRDVVAGTLAAIEKGRKGEKYILSGHYATAGELAAVASDVTGKNLKRLVLPYWVGVIGVPSALLYSKLTHTMPLFTYESLAYLKHSNRNISHQKATTELGYQPRPIEDSIQAIFEWFESQQRLSL